VGAAVSPHESTTFPSEQPRELLAEPTTEYCNVLVVPSGKSAKWKRGCLVPPAGTGEDGRVRCGPHLKEEELRLEWVDRLNAADREADDIRARFLAAGIGEPFVRRGVSGQHADPWLEVGFSGPEAKEILRRLGI
jgi:hypothetical protein